MIDGGIKGDWPGIRDGGVPVAHHPIRVKYLNEVMGQTGAVIDDNSKFFNLGGKK